MRKKSDYKSQMDEFHRRWLWLQFAIAFMAAMAFTLLVLLIAAGCTRRELYVYGDEFKSVELDVDWRQYADRDPDGMTVWFYSLDDPSHAPYRTTTASVRHQDIYLPGGYYQGVIIDYSPEEYSRQEFLDIHSLDSARVEATPSSYQPDSLTVAGEGVPKGTSDAVNKELFGEPAWNSYQQERPAINEEDGLYIVDNQPESMALDTLHSRYIDQGRYGDYIPWKERDTYQDDIQITKLYSEPTSIIWKLRIRVWIKSGFNYIWQTPSSISGLSNGHYLPLDVNTDGRSLLAIDAWDLERTGENSGYINVTLNTFGIRPSGILPSREKHGSRGVGDPGWNDYYTNECEPEELRLNLSFVLRDHATTLHYHFNVGQYTVSYDNQLVLRIELGPEIFWPNNPNGPDPIELPFVEAYNGTGFGAEVTPWVDQPPVDISF